ncbi:MAG: diguanylate cyclase domain-containing protein, partial [Mycobacteriaceae bacterium]
MRSSEELAAEFLLASGRQSFIDELLDSLDVGIVACDTHGRLTRFNATTRRWHGLEARGDVEPERFAECFSLYEADGSTPLATGRIPVLRALTEGRVVNAEIVIAPRDRPATRVVVNGRALHSADGALYGAVVAMNDITEQRRLEDDLRYQALHDDLTGLANRVLLIDRLETALAQRATGLGRGTALIMLDLDDFKLVNDTHGHDHGDRLLVAMARELVACCREGDTVARL